MITQAVELACNRIVFFPINTIDMQFSYVFV
jgi:hypothetical protein